MLWLGIQEALYKKGKYKMKQSHNFPNYRITPSMTCNSECKETVPLHRKCLKSLCYIMLVS